MREIPAENFLTLSFFSTNSEEPFFCASSAFEIIEGIEFFEIIGEIVNLDPN